MPIVSKWSGQRDSNHSLSGSPPVVSHLNVYPDKLVDTAGIEPAKSLPVSYHKLKVGLEHASLAAYSPPGWNDYRSQAAIGASDTIPYFNE